MLKPQSLEPHSRTAVDSEAASAKTLDGLAEVKRTAESLFTKRLGSGVPVGTIYVEEAVGEAKAWSLEIRLDRERYHPTLVLSSATSRTPGECYPLSVLHGVDDATHAAIAVQLGTPVEKSTHLRNTIDKMFRLFLDNDVVWLKTTLYQSVVGYDMWCSGSRLKIDDAANKRQQELFSQRDIDAEVPEEVEAERYSLVYVKLPGNIGTVVNGAGLAMATNDAIAHHGGASANFLDTGGQATVETMTKAFSIILGDARIKVILVNIYGGRLSPYRAVNNADATRRYHQVRHDCTVYYQHCQVTGSDSRPCRRSTARHKLGRRVAAGECPGDAKEGWD